MSSLPNYIPPRDADFNNWVTNFSTLLTAAPATYGLSAGDATSVDTVTDAWVNAYTAATNPSTRTSVTVAAKDTARITAEATIRPYAISISLNTGVATDDKIAIGVNPRTSTPQPIAAPDTFPVLSVVANGPLSQVFRYRDETASPSVKSKPYGVFQIQIFGMTSATVITDPTLLPLITSATKSPGVVTWSSGNGNKTAYFAARWITRTGLVGPWSAIVAATVPAA